MARQPSGHLRILEPFAQKVKRPGSTTELNLPNHQVTHHRPDDSDADRRIEGLGGPDATTGGLWYQDIDYLIEGLESGDYELWTVDQEGNSVWIVVDQRNGRKFLRTTSDGIVPNNLLALPHC